MSSNHMPEVANKHKENMSEEPLADQNFKFINLYVTNPHACFGNLSYRHEDNLYYFSPEFTKQSLINDENCLSSILKHLPEEVKEWVDQCNPFIDKVPTDQIEKIKRLHGKEESPQEALERYILENPEEVKKDLQRMKQDAVNSPSHYNQLPVEAIEICKHYNFARGNVLKYILRAGHKESEGMTKEEKELQDLKKAQWYLNYEIKQLEENAENSNKINKPQTE